MDEESLQVIEGFEVALPETVLSHGREGVEVETRTLRLRISARQRDDLVFHQRTLIQSTVDGDGGSITGIYTVIA